MNYHQVFMVIILLVFSSVQARSEGFSGLYVGGFVAHNDENLEGRFGTSASYSIHTSGFIGGAYVGYNFPISHRMVMGVEGDFSLANPAYRYSGQGVSGATTIDLNIKLKRTANANIRARLAFLLSDNFMLFGTAGLAIGKYDSDWTIDATNGATSLTLNDKQSEILTGFTLGGGGGGELFLMDHFVLRAEYLYTDFGTGKLPATFSINGDDVTANHAIDPTSHVIRAGLAYKF